MIIKDLIERYPILSLCEKEIRLASDVLKKCYENGGKLLVCGNGGSCADSDHICGELLKSFKKKRTLESTFLNELSRIDSNASEYLKDKLQGSLPVISLCNQTALMTATLNDVDGNIIFAQQVMGYGKKEDVFLGISTSGNSKDIIYASVVAKAKGLKTIGLLGKNGGRLKELCDISIVVPENETFKIQELHLPIYHAICIDVEEYFWKT